MGMRSESLLFVVGARPNFIKIAPICREMGKRAGLDFEIVHTGQHYDKDMSDVFFQELEIPDPDYLLHIGSGSHGQQTAQMMIKLEELCLANAYRAIIVIGDVNSTLAGAIVGSKLNIPVVHVEAGLRSYNRSMPEEINRVATDHVSDLLFAPTRTAMEILEKEGLADRSHFSGDVMFDMLKLGMEKAEKTSRILESLDLTPEHYYLSTLHRPYNVDDPAQLASIMSGLGMLDHPVVLSAHPRLQKNLGQFDIPAYENVNILGPLGYLDFILLEKHAKKVITDSGGVQKEAFFVQTPCVTLRSETEWTETVDTGANLLVTERTSANIMEAAKRTMNPDYALMPYGKGNASAIIVDTMLDKLWD